VKNFHTGDVFCLFKIDGVGAAQNDEETAVDVALVLLSLMPEVVKDEDACSDATHISSGAAIDEDGPGIATPLRRFSLVVYYLLIYCQRRSYYFLFFHT
jgi:hypothetical protein